MCHFCFHPAPLFCLLSFPAHRLTQTRTLGFSPQKMTSPGSPQSASPGSQRRAETISLHKASESLRVGEKRLLVGGDLNHTKGNRSGNPAKGASAASTKPGPSIHGSAGPLRVSAAQAQRENCELRGFTAGRYNRPTSTCHFLIGISSSHDEAERCLLCVEGVSPICENCPIDLCMKFNQELFYLSSDNAQSVAASVVIEEPFPCA